MNKANYREKIFYTTKNDGIMSSKGEFYSDGMSKDEIKNELLLRRKSLEKYGIDGTKIIIPSQDLSLCRHKAGHFENVTEIVNDILNDDPYFDLWDLDIPCDIMLIDSKVHNVSLAYPVADCPVVVLRAKDTLAIAHIPSVCVDRELPIQLVDAICSVSKCNDAHVSAYIGPCAGTSYVYETYPLWAKNEDWKHFITETVDGYSINLRKAIMSQLMRRGILNVTVSSIDTILHDDFYSNYAYNHGDVSKNGRFLTGACFEKVKEKAKK